MLTKTMTALLVVGTVVLPAPAARASEPYHYCDFKVVANEAVTGGRETYSGPIYGVVVSQDDSEVVSIRCYVTVNGTEVSPYARETGTHYVTMVGQTTFAATDADWVESCVEWWAGAGYGKTCLPASLTPIPPRDDDGVTQVAEFDATDIAGIYVCPVLRNQAPGVPGAIDIDYDGDVTAAGVRVWDCSQDWSDFKSFHDCNLHAVPDHAYPDTYDGTIYGIALTEGGPPGIRCHVEVNGAKVISGGGATNVTRHVGTYDSAVTFTARGGDAVRVCAEWEDWWGATSTTCDVVTLNPMQPREVDDATGLACFLGDPASGVCPPDGT